MKNKDLINKLERNVISDIEKNHKSAMDTIGIFYREHPELKEEE